MSISTFIASRHFRPMLSRALLILCLLLTFAPLASPAFAQIVPTPAGTCTNDPQFNPPQPAPGYGVVSSIVYEVRAILQPMTQVMFTAVNNALTDTLRAALLFYILTYSVLFTMGMVQLTLYDFSIRIAKIGVIVLLLPAPSWSSFNIWTFFNETVVHFFNDGTDNIISEVTSYFANLMAGIFGGTGPGSNPFGIFNSNDINDVGPFVPLDYAIAQAVSARMAVTLAAVFFTGPYGLLLGLLIVASLGSFVRALLTAVWVYLMSLVIKTLLFSLAPLFIVCLLFKRSHHIFEGWMNQIVNASLQPIMLFVFFSFFCLLIAACLNNVLVAPVCWTEAQESLRGSPFHVHFWRFEIWNWTEGKYEPYGGGWSFAGNDITGSAFDNYAEVFPIDFMTLLILFILGTLAQRFNEVVIMIANDLAGASINLGNFDATFTDWMKPARTRTGATTDVRTPLTPSGAPGIGVRGSPANVANTGRNRPGLDTFQRDSKRQGMVQTVRDAIGGMGAFRDKGR